MNYKPKHPTPLTNRQRRICDLICQGRLNKEIAFELEIPYSTVKDEVSMIFWKLGKRNRVELAVCWYETTRMRRAS